MSDDFAIEKPRIGRLSGPNYRAWSIQVERLLVSQGLWDTVVSQPVVPVGSEETSKPSGVSGAVQTPEDRKRDAKASTIIMSLCTNDVLQHILLLGTAKEKWEALKGLFQPLGKQQLSAKIKAFATYEPSAKATVNEVATQLSTLQYEIGTIDPAERPTENLKISVLFTALKEIDGRFDPLILQLEISDAAKDFGSVVQHLTECERRLGARGPQQETALRTNQRTGNSKGKRYRKQKFDGECYRCGKYGHRQADCPDSRGGSTGPLATPSGGRGLSPPAQAQRAPVAPANAKGGERAETAQLQGSRADATCWSADTALRSVEEITWVIDSGCTRHMTYARSAFIEFRRLDEPILVNTASGAVIHGVGEGSVNLRVALEGTIRNVKLTGVLYVPDLAGSLISASQLADRGITIRTTTTGRCLLELKGTVVGAADRIGKSYVLNSTTSGPESGDFALNTDVGQSKQELWHKRFGHLSAATLTGVNKATEGLNTRLAGQAGPCKVCALSKSVRVINRKSPERCTEPLQRIHTDIWGKYRTPSRQGNQYIITFTDDYTRKAWVYFVKERHELHQVFIQFRTRVELETGRKIRAVRCDNGPEYRLLGERLDRIYGIQFEYTTLYTLEQNGVAERLNRTLIQLARSMLLTAGLPLRFWEDAVVTACYLCNRSPVGPERKTPEEVYSGRKPYVGHLRTFGCRVYAHVPQET
jgi:hypothetical protein